MAALTTFVPDVGGTLRAVASTALAPFGDAGMYVATSVKTHVGSGDMPTREEHEELRRRAAELEARTLYLQERVRRQEDRIRQTRLFIGPALSQREMGVYYKLVPARVVVREALPYGYGGALNVGGAGGAVAGAPVTTRNLLIDDPSALLPENWGVVRGRSLVGRVATTWAFGARVRFVTDPQCQVPALILRDPSNDRTIRIVKEGEALEARLTDANNRPIKAIARGDGAEGMVIGDVLAEHSVRPGDAVVTSRDHWVPDNCVPGGIRVGTVTEVEPLADEPGFVRVRVRPAADLSALRRVYVVQPIWARER